MENWPRGLPSQMPKSLRCWGLHFNPMGSEILTPHHYRLSLRHVLRIASEKSVYSHPKTPKRKGLNLRRGPSVQRVKNASLDVRRSSTCRIPTDASSF